MNSTTYAVIKDVKNILASCIRFNKDVTPDQVCSDCALVNYGLDCCNNPVEDKASND
jgi:hypothetical protein